MMPRKGLKDKNGTMVYREDYISREVLDSGAITGRVVAINGDKLYVEWTADLKTFVDPQLVKKLEVEDMI